jgi:hypothetical protein
MDETRQRLGLRAVLALTAVVAVAAIFWAAGAFAAGGGGSPASEPGTRDGPAVENVQNEGGGPDGDCPERDGDRNAEPSSNV